MPYQGMRHMDTSLSSPPDAAGLPDGEKETELIFLIVFHVQIYIQSLEKVTELSFVE